jgi:hypothetical protein
MSDFGNAHGSAPPLTGAASLHQHLFPQLPWAKAPACRSSAGAGEVVASLLNSRRFALEIFLQAQETPGAHRSDARKAASFRRPGRKSMLPATGSRRGGMRSASARCRAGCSFPDAASVVDKLNAWE